MDNAAASAMAITVPLSDYAPAPPQIDRKRIPAEEQEALLHIVDILASLGRFERRFSLALMLFDFSHDENSRLGADVSMGRADFGTLDAKTNTLSGWQMMAAREGAMTIYHFGQTVEAIGSNLKACPTLCGLADHSTLRVAKKLFNATFPDYDAIRHVVAHMADFSATQKMKASHSIVGPWKGNFGAVSIETKDQNAVTRFTDNLYDRTYCITFEGKVYGYEITLGTLETITKIRRHFYSAFDPAVGAS
jgi:hypothetical protein